ncbi:pancreas/duodenum homeobox protein 1 [Desulfogranum marinum]|jgi:hypothetical protein|uniref:pancreas/duodenum homeobox protein 1 n=1 Tax=Desulfogranum marinum TaxID=453220 RepID=UPI001965E610|nr:pancreas/duodenum homeobox protein 1 [Desulfogranum marinum]MBM9511673.1 pancreas/duodenum homeobox protein 1 [Desulfogranum marinum]
MDLFTEYFTAEKLAELFPPQRSNDFFEALFGDAEEGAFDIRLAYNRYDSADETLHFTLDLHERPGKCLACNLTYGLPDVFTRHPIINLTRLIKDIDALMGDDYMCEEWKLGATQQQQSALHSIPLVIAVKKVE